MIQVFRYLSGFRNIECKQFEEKICKIAGLNEYLLELMIERSKNPKGLTEEELQFLSFAYTNIVDGLELKYRKLSETIRSIPDTNIRHEICQLLREKLRSKIKNEWLRMNTIICVQLFHARKDTLTQLYLLKLRADSCVYVCKSAVAARRTDLYNLTLNFYNQALLVARSESDNHPLSNELRENIKEFKDYIESQSVQGKGIELNPTFKIWNTEHLFVRKCCVIRSRIERSDFIERMKKMKNIPGPKRNEYPRRSKSLD